MIAVVYHIFLTGNWKEVVSRQLERLKRSGLYDESDIIWFTVNLNGAEEKDFAEVTKDYAKANIEYHINNCYEYAGIKKVKELADSNDNLKILYFHAKGVSNTYTNYSTKQINEEKIKNIRAWTECLEYFVIDKWKDCVEKLNEYDNVGTTCISGWYWGNFWWSQSKHIKKCRQVDCWGRWEYEAWLNSYIEDPISNFELFRFTYNPYVTYVHENWYKEYKLENIPAKINLLRAYYGTPQFEIDEGYSDTALNITKDVTEIVRKKLKEQNDEKFYFHVSDDTMDGSPCPSNKKFLFVEFYLNNDKNIYKLGTHQGMFLDQAF